MSQGPASALGIVVLASAMALTPACSQDDLANQATTGQGGSVVVGGARSSAGSAARAGAQTTSGGNTGTGGAVSAAAGNTGTGSAVSAAAGNTGTGGAVSAAAGNTGTGGVDADGGAYALGGASVTSEGGDAATGGATSAWGGSPATGGATASGTAGNHALGGVPIDGGGNTATAGTTLATAGTPGSAGASAGASSSDYCAAAPCRNGGTCSNGTTGYSCICPAGWSGPNCAVDVDACATSSHPCTSGGDVGAVCVDLAPPTNGYACTCSVHFVTQGGTCASDRDDDGHPDNVDNCPNVANSNQQDTDGDVVGNACDNCPNQANGSQSDADGDRRGDACDNCPDLANADQQDTDGDVVGNACDNCPNQANGSQSDTDHDGRGDACDNCPSVANADQQDTDGDVVGNACDNCPNQANGSQSDADGDRRGDTCDNCANVANADQLNVDGDKFGDTCDNCPSTANSDQADSDFDAIGNTCDNCPSVSNSSQEDADRDGLGNACDNCPNAANVIQVDTDLDGTGDACDSEPCQQTGGTYRCHRHCKAIVDSGGSLGDGLYALDPDLEGGVAPFLAYCDMTTDGGGWTMCYTENAGMVHIASEVTYSQSKPYGNAGYRTDCRNVPFGEVLYRNHDTGKVAWFSRDAGQDVLVATLGYSAAGSAAGLWSAHGEASTADKYQLNVCDSSWMWVGLMMSGYTSDCWKQCGNWCSDGASQYYRTDGDDIGMYKGVAFAENGHRNVGYKTMSVGIRSVAP